ncbi:uncharacterized protein LOC126811951 isoform X1 [Patella vulgata]|uniref:uncharacterized protein LOC126811951 isoform X1 n=1 Tax=Patella vulgata TaxID=6465 RepID=UPI00217F4499|nr:uncharacterized protein LOC126811951 isoform X1 [Patella vulgata]
MEKHLTRKCPIQNKHTTVQLCYLFVIISLLQKTCGGYTLKKCNIDDTSNVLLDCKSDHKISVDRMIYTGGCGENGNCSRSIGKEDSDLNLVCQGQYGKCVQPLNYNILDSCKGNKSVSAEITFTCEKNQTLRDSDELTTDTKYGSNDTTWTTNIFCPNKSIVYVDSVEYFKIVKYASCPGAGGLLPVNIPREQNRLNDLCLEKQECHPSLLYNFTREACQYTWPNMGANVVYRCLTNELVYNVCSKSVRTINNSLSTLYMTSPSSSQNDCGCLVYGDIQTVKILYINQSTINSTRDRLSFNPPTTVELNTNKIIYRDIADLVVKYNSRNHNNEKHLLEFKARSGSFLQLDCVNTQLKPTSSRLTDTGTSVSTAGYNYSQSSQNQSEGTTVVILTPKTTLANTSVNLTTEPTLANTTTQIMVTNPMGVTTTAYPTTNGHANTTVNLTTESTLANTTTQTTITNPMGVTTAANSTTNGHANTTVNLTTESTLANTTTQTTITSPMGVTTAANPTTNGHANTTVNLTTEYTLANTTTQTTITNPMGVTTAANSTTNGHANTTVNLTTEYTLVNTTTQTTITSPMGVTTTANPTTNGHTNTSVTQQQTIMTHSESGTPVSTSVTQTTIGGITVGTSVSQSSMQQTQVTNNLPDTTPAENITPQPSLQKGGLDGSIIGAIIGSIFLLLALLVIIIIIYRKRKASNNKHDSSSESGGENNQGFVEPPYFEVESDSRGVKRPNSLATDPRYQRIRSGKVESTGVAEPVSGYEAVQVSRPVTGNEIVENPRSTQIRVLSSAGEYEDVDLNDILEKDETRQVRSSSFGYADINEFNDSALLHPTKISVKPENSSNVQNAASSSSLIQRPPDKVEYAKVIKLKKKMLPNDNIQYGSMYDNSFDNIAPPIPDKNMAEEEINSDSVKL